MKIPEKALVFLSKQKMFAQKNSPHIMFAAGVVGVAASTVLACRATLRLSDTLDDLQRDIDDIKKDELQPYISHRHNPVVDTRRDIAFAYGRGCLDIAKLYAPAVIIGTASIAALTRSHVVMTRRNEALTAAYVTLSNAFEEYRGRVREEIGEERERELYNDGVIQVIQNADGTTTKLIAKGGECAEGLYARVFDEKNRNWVPNGESNRLFLEAVQAHLNNKLMVYHHVLLNDVYDALGFERTVPGCLVGWAYPSETGDNYIDFGIYEMTNADFVISGDNNEIYLDFNVDGVIYDQI
jgi:hypothetical protein